MEKNTLQNALNEISQGTTGNVDSFMIKDANGNQYWIKKADLASVLGELLRNDGYLKIKDYGKLTTSEFTTKNATIGFGYSSGDDGSGFSGIFLSVANESARFQIKSNINKAQIKIRQTNFNNDVAADWVDLI